MQKPVFTILAALVALPALADEYAIDYSDYPFHIGDHCGEEADSDHFETVTKPEPKPAPDTPKPPKVIKCKKATAEQLALVNKGNEREADFLKLCHESTGDSPWCEQLTRPNPDSQETFFCTYGEKQPHRLIHPDEKTWSNAIKAAQIVRDLEGLGVKVAQIYNWWRPEPYNKNVGGVKIRHPLGTAVDVRFATLDDMEKAHRLLCDFRKEGRLNALGYYGNLGLHLGITDVKANTWGKSCP